LFGFGAAARVRPPFFLGGRGIPVILSGRGVRPDLPGAPSRRLASSRSVSARSGSRTAPQSTPMSFIRPEIVSGTTAADAIAPCGFRRRKPVSCFLQDATPRRFTSEEKAPPGCRVDVSDTSPLRDLAVTAATAGLR